MVSSGMAAHDVESPFRSCPCQITPTTISPTHHWSLPLVCIDSRGQSAAGVGTDYLLYNHIYIIINITLIQWGMFMNVPHLHPLMVLAILRVQRSSWSHQGLSFQLGGFHRWDPMALLPAAGVHRLHLPLPIDDHFLDPTDGNQGLVKWEPKGWAISKFNWKKNCYIGCGKLEYM